MYKYMLPSSSKQNDFFMRNKEILHIVFVAAKI